MHPRRLLVAALVLLGLLAVPGHAAAPGLQETARTQLSGRLLAFLKNHKESFEAAGFTWRGEEKATPSDKLDIPEWLKGAGK